MSATKSRQIIDLSHPLSEQTPAFPGDPSPTITLFDSTSTPSTVGERHLNSSHIGIGLHCGTHINAPFHFFADGATIDQVPLERCIGPGALGPLAERRPRLLDRAAPSRAVRRPDAQPWAASSSILSGTIAGSAMTISPHIRSSPARRRGS